MDDVAYVWEARYRDAEQRVRSVELDRDLGLIRSETAERRLSEAEATLARIRQLADWLAMDPDANNAAAKAIRAALGDQP